VPKPVDPAALFAALLRWLPARAPEAPGTPHTDAAAAGPAPAAVPAVQAPAPDAPSEPGAVAAAKGNATGAALPGPLPEVPGLDVALALRYLGGQAGLYRRVLRQFLRHHAGAPQRTRAALAAGDTDTLKTLVHGLWGTAEPIGAAGLAQRAQALDRALAAGASAQALVADVAALLEELQRLLDAIGQALTAGPAEAEAGAATVDAPGLEALTGLLREGDYAAVAAWRSLAPALRRLDPAAAAELDARLLDFDFEGAVEVVEKLQPA
jgi:HPt (histidine-containing phosphotransfer) domain-containing protein